MIYPFIFIVLFVSMLVIIQEGTRNNGKDEIENQEEKTPFGTKGNSEWNG